MPVAVGLSQNANTRTAVREALERARFTGRPGWILAVAGRRHIPETLLATLAELLPGVPVYGGSCVGAMGAGRIGYSGNEIALAVFDHANGQPDVQLALPLQNREFEAGRELGDWLDKSTAATPVLLFYDVARAEGGINIGSRLLDGIYSAARESLIPPLFGAGLISDFQVTGSFLFDGQAVRRDAALALRMPEAFEISARVMHGCTPVSSLLTVTRAEGARIFELDGKPAASVLRDLGGAGEDREMALAFSVLLGRRVNDPLQPYEEAEYINRLIIDVDADSGAVSLFEEDIRTGDRVQVMVRNNALLMESVHKGVTATLAETAEQAPCFGLYIDCAGRASAFTGSEKEEAEQVLGLVGRRFPLFGFYVGREIAPFAGRSRPLDWTGVLLVFSIREEAMRNDQSRGPA